MKKIKLLFLIQSLDGGGAERVLVNLANHIDRERFEVSIRTIFRDGVNRQLLNEDVGYSCKRIPMVSGISRILKKIPKRLLYKYIVGNTDADIVIAFMHSIPLMILSGAGQNCPKRIGWIHCGDMNLVIGNKEADKWIGWWRKMDAAVCVSDYIKAEFIKKTGITENVYTVYNTNDTAKILELSCEKPDLEIKHDLPVICSIGRFTSEKGYSRLLEISKRLINEGLDHRLMLIGDGKMRGELHQKAEDLELGEKVIFTGFQSNPYKYISEADIFVCSSSIEGLSTATTEALILGLPIVSTDVSGAREILGDNDEWGIVTGVDDDSLYEGLKRMLSDESLRVHYREATKEREPFFDKKNTVAQAEKLFYEVLRK